MTQPTGREGDRAADPADGAEAAEPRAAASAPSAAPVVSDDGPVVSDDGPGWAEPHAATHATHVEATAGSRDLLRQLVVAISAVVAVVVAFIGSGAAGGTRIQDAAGGALDADATLLAPGRGAFVIWSVIYLGLLAYAVWQFLPSQRASERHRRLGSLVAASMLLNATWILTVQAGLLGLSVAVIALLLVVLCLAYATCVRLPPHRIADAILTDGTIGLYLGWVCVATAANLTAALVAAGFDGWGLPPEAWAVLVIAVATAAVAALGVFSRGGIAPMLSACWGLAWIAVARLGGEPASAVVGIAAIAGIVLIVGVTVSARMVAGRNRRLGSPR
ncbi:tryptophan-rich sensory protein [Agromyces sp. MMS24-K17]|uniref:tryptophan-rich sensory protein n=1 Tax=Agromyces sp. MMS24-K17 TaxID=3372850 RepID=UPI0037543CB6